MNVVPLEINTSEKPSVPPPPSESNIHVPTNEKPFTPTKNIGDIGPLFPTNQDPDDEPSPDEDGVIPDDDEPNDDGSGGGGGGDHA